MPDNKRLIFLTDTKEALDYVSKSNPFTKRFPQRDNPLQHADFISRKIQECQRESKNETSLTQEQVAAIHYKDGMYLEFSGAQNFDLATKSLENLSSGIRLLNVKSEDDVIKATIYVPNGKENIFLKKIQAYAESSTSGDKLKNNDLISGIEDVKLAVLESFWVGNREHMPTEDTPVWCEIWLRYDSKTPRETVHASLAEQCSAFEIELKEESITFPERIVVLVRANKTQLKNLISACAYIAEIRRAPELATFFDDLTTSEQQEWCQDLLDRTILSDSNSTVCVLDTGVCNEHPLIVPHTNARYIQAVDASWTTSDLRGHGTQMAGIALYRNLVDDLLSTQKIEVSHKLESVKILPDSGYNLPQLYGAITKQAISLAEIENPRAERSICMAVTSEEYNTNDGSPTSWSAAVDSITSGDEEVGQKRLFFVSAGNVSLSELQSTGFPTANTLHSVESPGQAWNAITVGGYNDNIEIQDATFTGFSSVADTKDLSPFSSTSVMWDRKWPVKPEILLNAGNVATNGSDYTDCPDLSLLTTSHDIRKRLFTLTSGTSPATAEASWMAAQLFKEYPNMWPETVRALLIHSADWTDRMQSRFNTDDKKSTGRKNLLRSCGYGIPSLEKAMWCKDNSVNMIVEGELQPFKKDGSSYKMKEMDLHEFPWPTEVLQALGDTKVRLRITLSYFIEPGPGEIGWKDRYRYPSCNLRFDLINNDEEVEDFKKRVNVKMRGDDRKDAGDGSSGSERWYLGTDNRDVGSIHSDFIDSSAVELCNAKYIAVYPVIGWWRERPHLGKYNSKIRYSLVVSLETPATEVDLYTPIVTKIDTVVQTEIATT
ncbi:MAG: S8 family peptidase [Clostridia bacterium]|nr:S8 family peptidase [Clostridia bacterium]